ncbi:MAG: hypothetical protein ACREX8_21705 [Gammaproteobacteria bacterium]
MRGFLTILALSLLLAAMPALPASGQTTTRIVASPSCLSDWWCGRARPPLGFYVRAVEEGGRYLTLEDGSVWEVEISDRVTTAAWRAEDFVGVRWIAAPQGDYEHLLSRVGQSEEHAEVRLAGRRPPAFRSADSPPAPQD